MCVPLRRGPNLILAVRGKDSMAHPTVQATGSDCTFENLALHMLSLASCRRINGGMGFGR